MNENPTHKQPAKPVEVKRTTYAKYKDVYNAVADAWKKEDQITSTLRDAQKSEPEYMRASGREHFSYHMARQIAFNQILNAMKPLLDELEQEEKEKKELKKKDA